LRRVVGSVRRGIERAGLGEKYARERMTVGDANRDESANRRAARDFAEKDA
jgi:hypothetical protein